MRAVRVMVVAVAVISACTAPSQAVVVRRRVVRPAPRRVVVVRPPVGARRVVVAGVPYWAHGGAYYKFEHDGYVLVKAPVIRVLPRRHRVVVIRGAVYYVSDGVYYRTAPGGYVVVEKPVAVVAAKPQVVESVPVVAAKPQTVESVPVVSDTVTLYVPKRAGDGFVAVTLKKLDGGYLGPQGEFYPAMPPVTLLTEIYGIAEGVRRGRSDVFFIHVPDDDGGSFTRVTLTRHNGGFLGPQGEFYPLMPSVAHLAEIYGKGLETARVETEAVRIQVPRKNGEGAVEVELKKHEQGYLGPQGEFYNQLPSADQLAELYGAQ